MRDEARLQRRRQQDAEDALDRTGPELPGSGASLVVRTTHVTTYPVAAKRYYAVVALDPGGDEVEGGTPTFANQSSVFYAANIGDAVPDEGTDVVATLVGGRWIFAHYGAES